MDKATASPFDHGFCFNCGTDLNGDWIWDVGFKKFGTEKKADAYAKAYGAVKGFGRFGREIYVKPYDENGRKLPPFFMCPDCGEKCYEKMEREYGQTK